MIDNKFVKLMKRPSGFPSKDTWSHEKEQVKAIKDGEILIKNLYVSLDPAMRGWLNEARSYIPPVKIGEVMRAGTIGEVIESKNSKFKKGDILSGWGGVQQYSISDGKGYFKINPSQIPLQTYIGTLGMPGMTAYFGILEVGKIKEGDAVLVSAAAGAVGGIVGQIAKIKGCKVIGIAGGKEKCDYVINELGFDGCIDYKNESVKRGIKRECPNGIDVYFDNVGGEILDSALVFLRMGARIVICGAISQYNEMSAKGPDNYLSLLVNRATMKGMVVFDYVNKYPLATKEMTQWIIDGSLKSKEDVYDGIENFYEIFKKLFNGEKKGKLILKL
ncbi:MAG: NADP-dependent oxidoreductase [Bacteroidetes bacterium]|jgi:NADPH-dependent curcumin reductase|nr:NADP-dependent oxidoreductase [Bacteroidota bacterium]MDA1019806.1 NADP-dependent oxidoreductase [Bacteroidota bacterium]|tara:strand:- start:66924 stop:67919 length:996 start_codon:yes stop_codon:yes gene_type:complete